MDECDGLTDSWMDGGSLKSQEPYKVPPQVSPRIPKDPQTLPRVLRVPHIVSHRGVDGYIDGQMDGSL